ncbi:MAG: hypothetical protein ABIK78_04645 [candidate division WOR-3 bacterium]
MKKIFILLTIFIFPLLAVDLKEKFGIGFGWNMPAPLWGCWTAPHWVCGKIGVSSKFAIEPYAILDYLSQEKYLKWGIGGILDYVFRSRERSNLYLKSGLKFESFLLERKWQYSKTGFIIGLGIEIWFLKNLSLDFSAYTECFYQRNYENKSSNFSASFGYPLALIFYY